MREICSGLKDRFGVMSKSFGFPRDHLDNQ